MSVCMPVPHPVAALWCPICDIATWIAQPLRPYTVPARIMHLLHQCCCAQDKELKGLCSASGPLTDAPPLHMWRCPNICATKRMQIQRQGQGQGQEQRDSPAKNKGFTDAEAGEGGSPILRGRSAKPLPVPVCPTSRILCKQSAPRCSTWTSVDLSGGARHWNSPLSFRSLVTLFAASSYLPLAPVCGLRFWRHRYFQYCPRGCPTLPLLGDPVLAGVMSPSLPFPPLGDPTHWVLFSHIPHRLPVLGVRNAAGQSVRISLLASTPEPWRPNRG